MALQTSKLTTYHSDVTFQFDIIGGLVGFVIIFSCLIQPWRLRLALADVLLLRPVIIYHPGTMDYVMSNYREVGWAHMQFVDQRAEPMNISVCYVRWRHQRASEPLVGQECRDIPSLGLQWNVVGRRDGLSCSGQCQHVHLGAVRVGIPGHEVRGVWPRVHSHQPQDLPKPSRNRGLLERYYDLVSRFDLGIVSFVCGIALLVCI
jgi:hypothetical protein